MGKIAGWREKPLANIVPDYVEKYTIRTDAILRPGIDACLKNGQFFDRNSEAHFSCLS